MNQHSCEKTRFQEVVGSNPAAMLLAFTITMKKTKGSQIEHTKKIFKKNETT
jgi:hypothetical protein